MTRLADAGRTVLLETSGSLDIALGRSPGPHHPRPEDTWVGSEEPANRWSNLALIKPTDEIKFVLCDRADFDWAVAQTRSHRLTERCPVLFSGCFGKVDPTELAAWILETQLPIRLQLQQHKILWHPAARGV